MCQAACGPAGPLDFAAECFISHVLSVRSICMAIGTGTALRDEALRAKGGPTGSTRVSERHLTGKRHKNFDSCLNDGQRFLLKAL